MSFVRGAKEAEPSEDDWSVVSDQWSMAQWARALEFVAWRTLEISPAL